jgi:hypothetical protein
MRILITNNTLATRAGSELYVRDLAIELLRRGHEPIAYSPLLGAVAEDLRAATVPVTDDLRSIRRRPDVIHGQHHLETMTALAHFHDVPAINVCHGWMPWQEIPLQHPRIRNYVAVDDTVRDRLVIEHGIHESDVRVILNFVDLNRFARRAALPEVPKRALIFSNAATNVNFAPVVRDVCDARGVAVDLVGFAAGNAMDRPEDLLQRYDIVFARGRAAIEAMATGAAVIVADPQGVGGMVTSARYADFRSRNFGIRTFRHPLNRKVLAREIAAYDRADAGRVTDRIRAEADLQRAVDAYLEIYADSIEASRGREVDPVTELRATGDYLRWLSRQTKRPGFVEWVELNNRCQSLLLQLRVLQKSEGQLRRQLSGGSPNETESAALSNDLDEGTDFSVEPEDGREALGREILTLRSRIAGYESSPFIRLRDRLYGLPPLVWTYRMLRRRR